MKKLIFLMIVILSACQPDHEDRAIGTDFPYTVRANGGLEITLPLKIGTVNITATGAEINFLSGVTSNIQTQLNGKAATSHTHTGTYLPVTGAGDIYTHNASEFSLTGHTQAQSTITGLPDSLLNHYTKAQTNSRLNAKISYADTNTIIATKRNIHQFPSYIIEQVGDSVFANPAPRSGYIAYADTNLTDVLRGAMNNLTSGGNIIIKEGTYDWLYTFIVPYENIRIKGAGKFLTKLKIRNYLEANNDEGTGRADLFVILSGFELSDIELDGNMNHQTNLDHGASITAQSFGVMAFDSLKVPDAYVDSVLINDCYIHDWAQSGVMWYMGNTFKITNSIIMHNGWGDIEFYGLTQNGVIENNIVGHTGNAAIDVYNINGIVNNNIVLPMDGVNGSGSQPKGIVIETIASWPTPSNLRITNNLIMGGNATLWGIVSYPRSNHCLIDGNTISNLIAEDGADKGVGIFITADTASTISNNKIFDTDDSFYSGMEIVNSLNTVITNNDIRDQSARGIYLEATDSAKVINNVVESHGNYYGAIRMASGSDRNKVINNILIQHSNIDNPISDAGTNNVKFNNYSTYRNSLIPSNTTINTTRTATADGTGNGIIVEGNQNITVTSANAAYICCLPTAGSTTIGTVITGTIGANGFELRVAASQATTVYLNGVTTNVEAAIPASTNFRVTQVDATHWILECTTNLGAVLTAIIPDAI